MTEWSRDELARIAKAEELEIAPAGVDGRLRKPVTIWVVAHDAALYVRSVNGRTAGWYRGTQEKHEGRISAGGVEKDVTFVDVGEDLVEEIDAAYRAKYRRYAGKILNSTLSARARSTTLRLLPRS